MGRRDNGHARAHSFQHSRIITILKMGFGRMQIDPMGLIVGLQLIPALGNLSAGNLRVMAHKGEIEISGEIAMILITQDLAPFYELIGDPQNSRFFPREPAVVLSIHHQWDHFSWQAPVRPLMFRDPDQNAVGFPDQRHEIPFISKGIEINLLFRQTAAQRGVRNQNPPHLKRQEVDVIVDIMANSEVIAVLGKIPFRLVP